MNFELETRWQLPFEREQVFAALADPTEWPAWWPGLLSATEDSPGDAGGIGRTGEVVWRAPFGYRVRFRMTSTRIEPPSLLEAVAKGDLTGLGTWRLTTQPPRTSVDRGLAGDPGTFAATDVSFRWAVSAEKRLMRALGPLGRPLLIWNHDRLMAAGYGGLTQHLSQ